MSIAATAAGSRLDAYRRFFADLVLAKAGLTSPRLHAAFAATPREAFLGPGPWQMRVGGSYVQTPDDPAVLYQDALFALRAESGINNGEPSLHARCLDALAPAPGEHVVHVGAGTGYYTAILSRLVAPDGRVTAYEVDVALAERAKANLADRDDVTLRAESAIDAAVPESDAIYVNAGLSHPARAWLLALRPAGRLLFPLTGQTRWGGMLLVTRCCGGYAARFVSRAGFIPCAGGQDPATAAALTAAFTNGGWDRVASLHLDTPPDDSCWFAGAGWWLSTASVT